MSLPVISLIITPYCRSTSHTSLRNTITNYRLFKMPVKEITTTVTTVIEARPMANQTKPFPNLKMKSPKKNTHNQVIFSKAMMKMKDRISNLKKMLLICLWTNQRKTKISWIHNSSILHWMAMISNIQQVAAYRSNTATKSKKVFLNASISYQLLEY